jgi:hypothetical protein
MMFIKIGKHPLALLMPLEGGEKLSMKTTFRIATLQMQCLVSRKRTCMKDHNNVIRRLNHTPLPHYYHYHKSLNFKPLKSQISFILTKT